MQRPEPHPDHLTDYATFKAIERGSKQAIEDKAIAAYMKAYEEVGKEEAERIFFSFFNKKLCTRKETSAAN